MSLRFRTATMQDREGEVRAALPLVAQKNPATDVWPSIVAFLADAPAESLRLLGLLAPWAVATRTHRIAGNDTAGNWRLSRARPARGPNGGSGVWLSEEPHRQTTLADGQSVEPLPAPSRPRPDGLRPDCLDWS